MIATLFFMHGITGGVVAPVEPLLEDFFVVGATGRTFTVDTMDRVRHVSSVNRTLPVSAVPRFFHVPRASREVDG